MAAELYFATYRANMTSVKRRFRCRVGWGASCDKRRLVSTCVLTMALKVAPPKRSLTNVPLTKIPLANVPSRRFPSQTFPSRTFPLQKFARERSLPVAFCEHSLTNVLSIAERFSSASL